MWKGTKKTYKELQMALNIITCSLRYIEKGLSNFLGLVCSTRIKREKYTHKYFTLLSRIQKLPLPTFVTFYAYIYIS